MKLIHGLEVYGVLLDDQTRCEHYSSSLDIVAIRFKCCGRWFPCRECHDKNETHAAEVWPRNEFDTLAMLCGACGRRLTISEYQKCGNICPACGVGFNPGCKDHYGLYFEVSG